MQDNIKIAHQAVAKKAAQPILSCFHFHDGFVQAGNGHVTIETPLDGFDGINVTVDANKLIKALGACDKPKIKVTAKNMVVTDGSFRAQLPLDNHEAYPRLALMPDTPDVVQVSEGFLTMAKRLRPFGDVDSPRLFARTILVQSGYAYTTDNITMARIKTDLPDMTLPLFAIDELIKIGIEPLYIIRAENYIGFDLGDGIWLRSVLIDEQWPDIESMFKECDYKQTPEGLLDAVKKVKPFLPTGKMPVVSFDDKGVSAGDANVALIGLPESHWNANRLVDVLSEATGINLHDAPAAWCGDGIEGFIIRVRL